MNGRLAGKVCLITGTSGAIGRASALAFAREGAIVVGCDLEVDGSSATIDMVKEAGQSMIALTPCDLAVRVDCDRVVTMAIEQYGRIDVLFNNAGRPFHGWMESVGDEHWFKTIESELHTVFLMSKAAWPALLASSGTIINMGSVSGWTTFPVLPGIAHSAAKGGVIALTRHLAMEGRHHGVRANSISPGTIATPAVEAKAKDLAWAEQMKRRIMRGSFGTPEEVAAVAVFLAADESSFVNATDIRVDGGTLAW
jgi:NAD(P)-dependent dehydrogenase (short-subunit alcohol dehydrogenase family)